MEIERPLYAVLPKSLNSGDEVILKGQVQNNPEQFSVNFTIDASTIPRFVAYHFKVNYVENIIVQNYKPGQWYEEMQMPNEYFDDLNFYLNFKLTTSEISTYQLFEDDGNITKSFLCSYPLNLELEDIKTVQVWGDVEKIQEITFKYE